MRSRRFFSLASAALLVLCVDGAAHAEPKVTRVRLRVDELPRADSAWPIAGKLAVLPSGAADRGPVPSSWKRASDSDPEPSSYCVEDRRADLTPIWDTTVYTHRIFESHGQTYFDYAWVEVHDGVVYVKEATRTPVVKVADGVWAHRTKDKVVLVAALDEGEFGHMAFWGCRLQEIFVDGSTGTFSRTSSASEADFVMRQMIGDATRTKKAPKWVGTELRLSGSVSRSSADPAPMLSLLVRSES